MILFLYLQISVILFLVNCEETCSLKDTESTERRINLPNPDEPTNASLEETIQKRRSIRDYQATGRITLSQLSQLFWASQGVTTSREGRFRNRPKRSSPSAGALFPIEIYIVVGDNSVEGLEVGIYHYDQSSHSLETQKIGCMNDDYRKDLSDAALGQEFIAHAQISFVFTAIYQRVTKKYKQRGIRYTHIEIGAAAQNLNLEAVALGLGGTFVGAFRDHMVQEVLGVGENHIPLCILPIGIPHNEL